MSSAQVTFDQVWQAEFAPLVQEKLARRIEHRSEAFLDCTLTVGGEEIRQMTPADLLMLDGFGNVFVCARPGSEAPREHVDFFLWQLHATNNQTGGYFNHYRRGQMLGRLRRKDYGKVTEEIWTYCERMFGELGPVENDVERGKPASLQKQPTSYFLAPLLVSVASEIGHIDPMSGELLSHTPLPRLIQYQNAARPDQGGDDDMLRLRARCADRMNSLNWKARMEGAASTAPV